MDQKDIEKIIDKKEELYQKISAHESNLREARSKVKYMEYELWVESDWNELLKKPTDKSKKAYVDGKVRPFKEKVEGFEDIINKYWREIDILNDKLKYLSGVNDD